MTAALLAILRDELAARIGAPDWEPREGAFASWSAIDFELLRLVVRVDLVAAPDGPELRLASATTGEPLAPPLLVLDEPLPRGGPDASEEAEVIARLPVTKRVEVPLPVAIEVVTEVARLVEEEREARLRRRSSPVQVLSPEAEEFLRRHGIDPAAAPVSVETITLQARPLATHRYGVDRLEWVPVPGSVSQDPPGERGRP